MLSLRLSFPEIKNSQTMHLKINDQMIAREYVNSLNIASFYVMLYHQLKNVWNLNCFVEQFLYFFNIFAYFEAFVFSVALIKYIPCYPFSDFNIVKYSKKSYI